jgi:hypothetical protein
MFGGVIGGGILTDKCPAISSFESMPSPFLSISLNCFSGVWRYSACETTPFLSISKLARGFDPVI